MKIKITKASKYLAQGQVVECPKSVGLRFIALGKAVEYKDEDKDKGNDNGNDNLQDELDRSTQSLVQTAESSQTEVVNLDSPPTPRRKRKPRKPRSN